MAVEIITSPLLPEGVRLQIDRQPDQHPELQQVFIEDDLGQRSFWVDATQSANGSANPLTARESIIFTLGAFGLTFPDIATFLDCEGRRNVAATGMARAQMKLGASGKGADALATATWRAFDRGFYVSRTLLSFDSLPEEVRDNWFPITFHQKWHAERGVIYEHGKQVVNSLVKKGVVRSPTELVMLTQLVPQPELPEEDKF